MVPTTVEFIALSFRKFQSNREADFCGEDACNRI